MFEEERDGIGGLHRKHLWLERLANSLYNSPLYNPPIGTGMEAQMQPDLGV